MCTKNRHPQQRDEQAVRFKIEIYLKKIVIEFLLIFEIMYWRKKPEVGERRASKLGGYKCVDTVIINRVCWHY